MKHILKSEEAYFQAVWERRKLFEIRKNDRGYNAGDTVILREWREDKFITTREITATISYVTNYAQREEYVVFAMVDIENWEPKS